MSRRGHILALMMIVLAAVLAGTVGFTNRFSIDLSARRQADLRIQALWLARSALDAGITGTQQVQTASGPAVVEVRAGPDGPTARVELGGLWVEVGAGTERVGEGVPAR